MQRLTTPLVTLRLRRAVSFLAVFTACLFARSGEALAVSGPAKKLQPPGRFQPVPYIHREYAFVGRVDALPFPSISARIEYADKGAVRFVVTEGFSTEDLTEVLWLEVRNEGQREYVVLPKDRFFAIDADGKALPLEPDVRRRVIVLPGASMTMELGGAAHLERLLGLRVKSECVGREVDITELFEDAQPLDMTPARYELNSVRVGPPTPVVVAAVVGPDGSVETILDLPSGRNAPPKALLLSARAAMKRWTFTPARQGSTAVRTVHLHIFWFGKTPAFRAVVPGSAREIEKEIARVLQDEGGIVGRIPQVGGFVVGEPLSRHDVFRRARALLIRCGAEPDGGVWITTAFSRPYRQIVGDAPCGCDDWSYEEDDGARKALRRLMKRIKAPASPIVTLTGEREGSIPSGLAEPVRNSFWNRDAVLHVLRWTMAVAAGSDVPKPEDLPPHESFLVPAPPPVAAVDSESGIVEPKKIRDARPDYPAAARLARVGGKVTLNAIIDERGCVEDVEVIHGNPLLSEAASKAVYCWGFEPPMKDGRPTRMHLKVLVNFHQD